MEKHPLAPDTPSKPLFKVYARKKLNFNLPQENPSELCGCSEPLSAIDQTTWNFDNGSELANLHDTSVPCEEQVLGCNNGLSGDVDLIKTPRKSALPARELNNADDLVKTPQKSNFPAFEVDNGVDSTKTLQNPALLATEEQNLDNRELNNGVDGIKTPHKSVTEEQNGGHIELYDDCVHLIKTPQKSALPLDYRDLNNAVDVLKTPLKSVTEKQNCGYSELNDDGVQFIRTPQKPNFPATSSAFEGFDNGVYFIKTPQKKTRKRKHKPPKIDINYGQPLKWRLKKTTTTPQKDMFAKEAPSAYPVDHCLLVGLSFPKHCRRKNLTRRRKKANMFSILRYTKTKRVKQRICLWIFPPRKKRTKISRGRRTIFKDMFTFFPKCEHLLQSIKNEVKNEGSELIEIGHLLDNAVPCDEGVLSDDKRIDLLAKRPNKKKGKSGAIVPCGDTRPHKKIMPRVDLDLKTLYWWDRTDEDGEKEKKEKERYWETEREVFWGRIQLFRSTMHIVLGNRKFKRWKSSVINSIVGVFLTQNVSDNLSSAAYMSLAAKFPIKLTSDSNSFDHGEARDLKEDLSYFVNSPEPECSQVEEKTENDSQICDYDKKRMIMDSQYQSMNDLESNNVEKYPDYTTLVKKKTTEQRRKAKLAMENEKDKIDWEYLRKTYSKDKLKANDQLDSIDWEAIRIAPVKEIAQAIEGRGQHNQIAERIKNFLNQVVEMHPTTGVDLEWLRDAPPDKVQLYLLEIDGLGLKSVECVRLLELFQKAFPVDTNVGRIAIRLGWVPLKPLEEVPFHLLESYPSMDSIQKYLWPRISHLPPETLYELHYQLITFGKVFCTKRKPSCNTCPLKGSCKHFASVVSTERHALPATSEKTSELVLGEISTSERHALPATSEKTSEPVPDEISTSERHALPATSEKTSELVPDKISAFLLEANSASNFQHSNNHCCEGRVEEPMSVPEPDSSQSLETDIEDLCNEEEDDDDEMPHYKIISQSQEVNKSRDLDLPPEVDYRRPTPKLKYATRLRTEHLVYELPDDHSILGGLMKHEKDDTTPYLLAIWKPGELPNSFEPPEKKCNSQGSELCNDETCSYCCGIREEKLDIVRGTILIPVRTAMRSRFPLNGTYFQVNEVFADHETSHKPINVPRELLYNLKRSTVYCGTSAMHRGQSAQQISEFFWTGYVCTKAIDLLTREPHKLALRFHCPLHMLGKKNKNTSSDDSNQTKQTVPNRDQSLSDSDGSTDQLGSLS